MTGRDWVLLVTGAIVGGALAYTWQDLTFWLKQYKLRKFAEKEGKNGKHNLNG